MPDFFIPKSEKELTENIHVVNFALEKLPSQIEELVSFIDSINNKAKTYLVGGSVRDSILSAKTGIDFQMKDFDLEVYGVEHRDLVSSLIEKYGSENVDPETGKSFKIIKLKIEGIPDKVDIALPRTERKLENSDNSSSRGRGIEPFPDPYLDQVVAVKRRDLTINSILYDPITKQIIDPYGGWYDLMNGVLRITDADSFREDPLRVLRVAQFASRFGFKIHQDTINLCRDLVSSDVIDSLVRDRVADELDKLLIKGFAPSLGLKFLQEIGYLKKIMPEVSILESIPQEPDYHPEGDVFTHTMQVVDAMAEIIRREKDSFDLDSDTKRALMLGALFHDLGKAPKTIIDANGRITSYEHEEAGVPLAQNIIRRLYKTDIQASKINQEDLILFLVSKHMTPILLHEDALKGINMTKGIRKFMYKCIQNNVSIEQISWIVEADKRGRNAENKNKPLSLEQKPDLEEALKWFAEFSKISIQDEISKDISILDVPNFLKEINSRAVSYTHLTLPTIYSV